MEELIVKCIEILKNCCLWVGKTCVGFADATGKAELNADFGTAFFIALGIAFVFGSGCWAASIGRCRNYKATPHFLAGLVLPWIYPLIILFTLDIKGAKKLREAMEAERLKKLAEEEERNKNIALNTGIAVEEEEKPVSAWNQAYFEKIARKEDGTPAGPWNAVYGGNGIKVVRIIEALPDVVNVEFVDMKGNPGKIRIPYLKIESWENAE